MIMCLFLSDMTLEENRKTHFRAAGKAWTEMRRKKDPTIQKFKEEAVEANKERQNEQLSALQQKRLVSRATKKVNKLVSKHT